MNMWIIVAAAIVIGFGSTYFLKADNPVEQIAEEVVEAELHLPKGSVDFTPKSK